MVTQMYNNNTDCKTCENQKWKAMYITAQERFDKVGQKLTVGFIIVFVVMLVCLMATIGMLYKTMEFINEFEYVEETEISIEQDCRGKNTVILADGTEVKSDGTEIHGNEEEILAKENNKTNNTITIGR